MIWYSWLSQRQMQPALPAMGPRNLMPLLAGCGWWVWFEHYPSLTLPHSLKSKQCEVSKAGLYWRTRQQKYTYLETRTQRRGHPDACSPWLPTLSPPLLGLPVTFVGVSQTSGDSRDGSALLTAKGRWQIREAPLLRWPSRATTQAGTGYEVIQHSRPETKQSGASG